MRRAAGRAARTSRRRTAAAGTAMLAAALMLGACRDTRYDASIPSGPTTIAATTTLPTGPATALLPRLVTVAASLSATITSKGDEDAVVGQANDLWNAAKQEVAAQRPELLGAFETNVAKLAEAASFNRAADADKATKNLDALTTSFLATATTAMGTVGG